MARAACAGRSGCDHCRCPRIEGSRHVRPLWYCRPLADHIRWKQYFRQEWRRGCEFAFWALIDWQIGGTPTSGGNWMQGGQGGGQGGGTDRTIELAEMCVVRSGPVGTDDVESGPHTYQHVLHCNMYVRSGQVRSGSAAWAGRAFLSSSVCISKPAASTDKHLPQLTSIDQTRLSS